jgi:hypothetical protein
MLGGNGMLMNVPKKLKREWNVEDECAKETEEAFEDELNLLIL